MVFAKVHTAKEKSRTPRAWRDFCWAAFLAGGVFFLSGLMYGVLAGVAVPLQDPTPAERAFEKFHLQISQWLMCVGGGLSAVLFFLSLGKEIIRQLFRC